MAAQFFYGTLCDADLRAIVLGRDTGPLPVASLPDHAVHHAGDAAWPLIRPSPGAQAQGLLAADLTAADLARLAFYEGGFGYHLRAVTVQTVNGPCPAQAWFPGPDALAGPLWSLADWAARHGPLTRAAAQEAMALCGQVMPDHLPKIWKMIESRAQARLTAMATPDRGLSGRSRADVVQRAARRPYQNFFAVSEYDLQIRQFDNSLGPQIERAVFLSSDAALVLPYDPRRDCVLLVEQFRMGPYARGDGYPWCLEPIAGIIDGGETPESTARREALEEANLVLDQLIPIGSGYSSPGDSTNHFHMFCAPCALPASAAGIGGLMAEAENIRSHVLPFASFLDLLDGGRLNVVPLQAMGHWLARHRDGLRAAVGAA